MATLSNITTKFFTNSSQGLVKANTYLVECIRFASKKTGSTTQNAGNSRPKHRGWKRQDGTTVQSGTIVAKQNKTRWHPGLNVGFGKNGDLVALCTGKVIVTCEVIDPNWDHTWIQSNYGGREGQTIYKKHFNVIPEPQHQRFKLIDKV